MFSQIVTNEKHDLIVLMPDKILENSCDELINELKINFESFFEFYHEILKFLNTEEISEFLISKLNKFMNYIFLLLLNYYVDCRVLAIFFLF